MSHVIRRTLYLLVVLSLAALACSTPGSSEPTATPGTFGQSVETAVAGTVQALTRTAPTEAATRTLAAPGSTPSATLAPIIDTLPTAFPSNVLRVAYIDTSRNLWLWVEGGGNIQLTHSEDVASLRLAPDGEQVVFVRASASQSDASLWAIARNGSAERQLLSQDQLRALAPASDSIGIFPAQIAWVPGRNQVAVGTRAVFDGPGMLLSNNLILVDLGGSAPQVLFPPGEGGMFYYSADGAKIALVRPDQIDLVNADGSERRSAVLAYPAVSTYSEYQYYPTPVWTADGGLRVAIPPAAPLEDPSAATAIWHIPADGSAAVQTGAVVTAPLRWPLLSPDGERVAFLTSPPDSPGPQDLNLAGTSGGSGIELYTNNGGSLDLWTPDSQRFVYHEHNAATAMLGTPGAMSVPLTDALIVRGVLFSADGRVVFLSMVDTSWEVRTSAPAGPSTLIASFPASDNYPQIDTMR